MPFTPKQLEGFRSYECVLEGHHSQGTVQQVIRIKRDVERKFLGCLWPVKGITKDAYYYQANHIRNDVVNGRATHIYEMCDVCKEDVKFLKDYVAGLWSPTKKET